MAQCSLFVVVYCCCELNCNLLLPVSVGYSICVNVRLIQISEFWGFKLVQKPLADWPACILKGRRGETFPWTWQNYLSPSQLFAESAKLRRQSFLNPFWDAKIRLKIVLKPLQWQPNLILNPCVPLSRLPLWFMCEQTVKLVEIYSICWHEKYKKRLENVIHLKPYILCNNCV